MKYSLPELPYTYDQLEPFYDFETVRIHHSIHHREHIDCLNLAIKNLEEAELAKDTDKIIEANHEISFHKTNHILHSMFWENISPKSSNDPHGLFLDQIEKDFGGIKEFKKEFLRVGTIIDNSGWVIAGWNIKTKRIEISFLEAENDVFDTDIIPVIVCDLWEHAYYLKFRNKRPLWLIVFIDDLINWFKVNDVFADAKKQR